MVSSHTPTPVLPAAESRSVTPSSKTHEDVAMNSVGWAAFLLIGLLLLPLLPALAVVWLGTKLFGTTAQARDGRTSEPVSRVPDPLSR
ncbi:DUF7535 family protein [Haloarchaeobius sp. TZWWS8]|uniref:DUF7535 family protein n=1 Tax=Haloarchaeobius sp. TZWWS8 TaxID=3446121 RepID=UPI003EBBDBAC